VFVFTVVLAGLLACCALGCGCGISLRPMSRALWRGLVAALTGGRSESSVWVREAGVMSQCHFEWDAPEPRYRAGNQGFRRSGEVEVGTPFLRRWHS
jgi:hypothetical protein